MKWLQSEPLRYPFARNFAINFNKPQVTSKSAFPSNSIKTSRYNIFTFLPIALLIQFQRYANIYFLITAIIQSISILSPLNPFSAIAPLVFVLSLSIAREGFEDYNRHQTDKVLNSSEAWVMRIDNASSSDKSEK